MIVAAGGSPVKDVIGRDVVVLLPALSLAYNVAFNADVGRCCVLVMGDAATGRVLEGRCGIVSGRICLLIR